MRKRLNLHIKGRVQGVGFRPFIYNLARKHRLAGYVRNDPSGVHVEVEGEEKNLRRFILAVKEKAPPASYVKNIHRRVVPLQGEEDFLIAESRQGEEKFVFISPDISICKDCFKELFSPGDRRFHYPFINCTNCGPRYSIIEDVPYDRRRTSMREFKMCSSCEKEYYDPHNRRFHAQPNACFRCGPSITLVYTPKERRAGKLNRTQSDAVFKEAASLIARGKIIAVKGLGGYHISCDAYNRGAVDVLRQRKRRPTKPFALMAADLATVKRFCYVNAREEKILTGARRPIVLLRIKKHMPWMDSVAPYQRFLGVMLAYTPVHHLLLHYLRRWQKYPLLVMTSANHSGEPLIYRDRDIFTLKSEVDAFLMHNRRIYVPVDDSIVRVYNRREYILRKARGYVPDFIRFDAPTCILGCGAQLKSTFSLARGRWLVTSPYLGDLHNEKTYTYFIRTLRHFQKVFSFNPEVVAYDCHPEYMSSRYALSLSGVKKVPVQHHHAHAVSCMVENNLNEDVIAVVFDGVGLGTDGAIWGGEFLVCNRRRIRRYAHFDYFPLVGKDKAIEEPYRVAAALLYEVFGEEVYDLKGKFVEEVGEKTVGMLVKLIQTKHYVPSSSVGRLFDAVASLLRLKDKISYEAEAAILLEMVARTRGRISVSPYTLTVKRKKGKYVIEWRQMIKELVNDVNSGSSAEEVSYRFHLSLAEVTAQVCSLIKEDTGYEKLVLSGGVFQNALLLNMVMRRLRERGLKVYIHSRFPPNDECISVGQVAVAAEKIKVFKKES